MGIRIIGTGHIFEKSVREVREAIYKETPDIVAVELDFVRFKALEEQNFSVDLKDDDFKLNLNDVVRGGSLLVFLQRILSMIQKELGRRYGIKPGADMCAAILAAKDTGSNVALIDRNIDITMNHILAIPFREKMSMFKGVDNPDVLFGLLGGDLERILEEENLNRVMDYLKKTSPSLYSVLVDERDRYMALQLDMLQKKNPDAKIIAVVGAGHRRGIQRYLERLSSGDEISLRPLIEIKRVSVFGVLFLIFGVVVAYMLMKIGSR